MLDVKPGDFIYSETTDTIALVWCLHPWGSIGVITETSIIMLEEKYQQYWTKLCYRTMNVTNLWQGFNEIKCAFKEIEDSKRHKEKTNISENCAREIKINYLSKLLEDLISEKEQFKIPEEMFKSKHNFGLENLTKEGTNNE